jgi:hypothetical protein
VAPEAALAAATAAHATATAATDAVTRRDFPMPE